ncbi:MAG: O-antigen ligase family protein [Candidatus Omnitrophica bacterium]|nr:O-antigen ligase family protein [Candidatus Omnitrophota bacterium]
MPLLNIIFLLSALCVSWLVFRRLSSYSFLVRLIIISLAGVLFFRPLVGEGFFLYPKIIFENIILISGFLLLLSKCRSFETKIVFSSADKIFFAFLIMLAISLSRSANLHSGINQLIYFLSVYLLYWSIKNLPDDRLIKGLLLKTFIACGILLIIYAVHQYTVGFSQMRDFLRCNPEYGINSSEFAKRVKQNLIFATFIYPPAFGDYLSMLFLTLCGVFYIGLGNSRQISQGTLLKHIPLLILFCIIPILILTKSKGAWVSLFAGLTLFYILNKNSSRPAFKPIYAGAVFIVSFVCIGLFSKTILPNLKNFIISYEIRLEYWKAAIMMIREHPLSGFGPGTFASVYPLFKTKLAEETIMAHNSFLQLWAESGFFSLTCFALFVCLLFTTAFKNRSRLKPFEVGAFAAFFSFLLQNLFDFGLFDAQRSTVAFGLLGLYSLSRAKEGGYILITSKKTKITMIILCGILLLSIMIYSTNIYLGRKFDTKAAAMLKTGQVKAAVDCSEIALRHNPLAAEYFYHRAYISEFIARENHEKGSLRLDRINNAVSNYLKAIGLNPYAAYYHFRLAKLLFISKQIDYEQRTLFHLKKAVEMYPVNPFYHEQLAEFYGIIKNQRSAEYERSKTEELKKYFKKGTRD